MAPADHTVLQIILLMTTYSSINSQPLDQPAEKIPCGALNKTCDRWGYNACVNPDGEFYCLPCHLDYISHLCGTKNQLQGCNLYCTQKKLEIETEKLHRSISEETEEMQNNFTATLREEKFHSKNQTQEYKKDEDRYLSKIKALEDAITVEKTTVRIYQWTFLFSSIVLLPPFGFLIIWFLRSRKRNKTIVGLGSLEMQNLLEINPKNRSLNGREECEISKKNIPAGKDNTTQNVYGHKHERRDGVTEDSGHRSGISCPGKDLLQNVSPTNDRDGCDKMAIHVNDIDVPGGE